MRVGIVVVTYDSGRVLADLLDSLTEHEPQAPVVVVDDASPAGAPDSCGVELLVSSTRRGYGAACNRGVEVLRSHGLDVVAFFNPDVRLIGPSLTEALQAFERRPELGIASGPMLNTAGERMASAWGPTSVRRALAFAAGYEPRRLRSAAGGVLGSRLRPSRGSHDVGIRVDGHVRGGTMLCRLDVFDELGGFDEDFFLYWEDADLCARARAAGYEIRLLPCTPFVMADLPSSTTTDDDRWDWFVEGASRFGHKHLVPGQARQLEAALGLGRRLARLRERG